MKSLQTYDEFLNERYKGGKSDQVFIQNQALWVSHWPGSGSTTEFHEDPARFRGYKSNDLSDNKHFDSNVTKILKWAKDVKPLDKKDKTSLYKIPVYPPFKNHEDFTVWGGDVKPTHFIFMLIATGGNNITYLNFFKTRKEALLDLLIQYAHVEYIYNGVREIFIKCST